MANRYYTLMIVPEKTSNVRRVVIPAWVARSAAAVLAVFALAGIVMVLDYWYVMNQISENKQLKLENRRLRQQVQIFRNKLTTIESTLDRVKTFATRLKVITNIEDRGNLLESLNGPLPDAATNVGTKTVHRPPTSAANATVAAVKPSDNEVVEPGTQDSASLATNQAVSIAANAGVAATATASSAAAGEAPKPSVAAQAFAQFLRDPEDLLLRKEEDELNGRCSTVNTEALWVEQLLQDLYELLADQKSFLAALPTRKPVVGYFTSGFGVRHSPFGGKVKMHEGLDIANRPGTPIRAPADGVVTFAATKAGYGQTVIVDHGYGIESWYGHSRKLLVAKGQKIRRGEIIAQLGSSGRSTGPHCHYEVRVHGYPVDPLSYILEN